MGNCMASHRSKLTILVVDDFDTMLKIIRNILSELGYNRIITAKNGEIAYQVICNEPVDLVISDWNMPKMSGIELLKTVRSNPETADTPFIMVTAESEKGHIIEAIKEKVDDYMIKPFNAEMLGGKISHVLNKKRLSRLPTPGA